MCIRIVVVDLSSELAQYLPADVTIVVRRPATPASAAAALAETHAILSDLDSPGTMLCFCGDPITLPPELATAPAGRRDDHRQVLRGA